MADIADFTANRFKVGIIGATGMVGQRLVTLLANHPYFEIAALAASSGSSGKTYGEATCGRWLMERPIPNGIENAKVLDASRVKDVAELVDFVFCAVSLSKAETLAMEEEYAKAETPVVSCNSPTRMLPDVPMIIPEINPHHASVIDLQRKRLGTSRGFIAVKPNCSIQSYVPALHPLMEYMPEKVIVCTYQAVSGAGKTLETWPEMHGNVIPYIAGEDEKSEREPMKIWGTLKSEGIVPAERPAISAQCLRVPVLDGHLAAVSVSFAKKPKRDDILAKWSKFAALPQQWKLPSAPEQFLKYFEEPDRPQSRLDRDYERGMGITIGRLREDSVFDYKFVALSHNTLRGAAGGAVLMAEVLATQGYIMKK